MQHLTIQPPTRVDGMGCMHVHAHGKHASPSPNKPPQPRARAPQASKWYLVRRRAVAIQLPQAGRGHDDLLQGELLPERAPVLVRGIKLRLRAQAGRAQGAPVHSRQGKARPIYAYTYLHGCRMQRHGPPNIWQGRVCAARRTQPGIQALVPSFAARASGTPTCFSYSSCLKSAAASRSARSSSLRLRDSPSCATWSSSSCAAQGGKSGTRQRGP